MKQKWVGLVAVFAMTILACGVNPVAKIKEKVEEQVVEQVAELVVEQVSGAEDVQIDIDGESASFSIDDGEGGSVSMDMNSDEEIISIAGMGFDIALPDGLVDGRVQRIEEDGVESMVAGTFGVDGTDAEQFFQNMHEALTAAGFVYRDIQDSGATAPDPSIENFLPMAMYEHPDGFSFSATWNEERVVLGLLRNEED